MTLVREIMTNKVIVLYEHMTLCEATEIMSSNNVSGAPVVDEHEKLVGILSERDILEYAKCTEGTGFRCPTLSFLALPYEEIVRNEKVCQDYRKIGQAKVSDVMNQEVVTIGPDEDVDKALETMVRFEINRIPVVEDDRLIGIIARQDILWTKCQQSMKEHCPTVEELIWE